MRSSYSGADACVEVELNWAPGRVVVWNSREPSQRVLVFTRAEWNAFLRGVRTGEFDLPEEP